MVVSNPEQVFRYSHNFWFSIFVVYIFPYLVITPIAIKYFQSDPVYFPIIAALLVSLAVIIKHQIGLYSLGTTIFVAGSGGRSYPELGPDGIEYISVPWQFVNDIQSDRLDALNLSSRQQINFTFDSGVYFKPPTYETCTLSTDFGEFITITFSLALDTRETTNKLFVCKQLLTEFRKRVL